MAAYFSWTVFAQSAAGIGNKGMTRTAVVGCLVLEPSATDCGGGNPNQVPADNERIANISPPEQAHPSAAIAILADKRGNELGCG